MRFRVLLVVLAALTSSSYAGVLFTAEMSRSRGVSTYKTWAEGKSFKAVVESTTERGLSNGNFLISRDGGATLIAASARWKRYLELSPEELQQRLGTRPLGVRGRVENLSVQKLADADGGLVAGYRTRRHTLRVSVEMRSRSFWRGDVTRHMVITETLWMAESVPNPCPELAVLMQESIGTEEVDRALALNDAKGFPMKRVIEVEVDGERLASSSAEVKALIQMPVADSVFAVPANYKRH
jgi:hypothetical protein